MLIFDIFIGCQDSQMIDLEVSGSLQLRGNLIHTEYNTFTFNLLFNLFKQ